MKLHLEWSRPMPLRDATRENLIYAVDLSKLPKTAGVYVLGRRFGKGFEALYVGRANNVRSRVKAQVVNLKLMLHLKNAKAGKRILVTGRLPRSPASNRQKTLNSSNVR